MTSQSSEPHSNLTHFCCTVCVRIYHPLSSNPFHWFLEIKIFILRPSISRKFSPRLNAPGLAPILTSLTSCQDREQGFFLKKSAFFCIFFRSFIFCQISFAALGPSSKYCIKLFCVLNCTSIFLPSLEQQ